MFILQNSRRSDQTVQWVGLGPQATSLLPLFKAL